MQTRVDIWLDPWKDPSGKGYQIVQSLFALAAGGLFGRGLGQGYLILQSGNTIIPAPGDRLHLLRHRGGAGAGGGGRASSSSTSSSPTGACASPCASRDDFSRLLATGLTSIFALQAFIIMGGVIKLIPLTGITLPFVSYGGSSIVANFVLLALLLRASDRAAERRAGARSGVGRRAGGRGAGPWIGPSAGSSTSSPAVRGPDPHAHLRAGVGGARASRSTRPTPGPSRRR